MYWSQ